MGGAVISSSIIGNVGLQKSKLKAKVCCIISAWPYLLFVFSLSAQEYSISEIIEKATPGVVQIVTYDITGARRGLGSGFFIAPGKLLTNAHVMEKAYSAEVYSENEYYNKLTILKYDEETDLALIEVGLRNETIIPLEEEQGIRPGQRIITIGNPLGFEKTISDGLISAIREASGNVQIIQISAPISPGSSGGPLLNLNGNAIGVTTSMIKEGQNLNFAIGIESIFSFLHHSDEARALPPAKSRVLWRAILRRIVAVVVGLLALVVSGVGWWIFVVIFVIGSLFVGLFKFTKGVVKKLLQKKEEEVTPIYEPGKGPEGPELYAMDKSFPEDEANSLIERNNHFTFHCWKCGAQIKVKLDLSSESIECPNCGTLVLIPHQ